VKNLRHPNILPPAAEMERRRRSPAENPAVEVATLGRGFTTPGFKGTSWDLRVLRSECNYRKKTETHFLVKIWSVPNIPGKVKVLQPLFMAAI